MGQLLRSRIMLVVLSDLKLVWDAANSLEAPVLWFESTKKFDPHKSEQRVV